MSLLPQNRSANNDTPITYSQEQIKRFLATPCNWPNIVASSWSVKGDSVNVPLKPQSQVKEILDCRQYCPTQCFLNMCSVDRRYFGCCIETRHARSGL
mmetsp:Transcript_7680/g.14034  ORF Transcript_7680/g.14034 Transcript_7680/m.14034 type:complete len:98 (+) Transcript_7680:77-370(+)